MYQPGGGRQPEMDFEQVLAQIRNALNQVTRRLGGGGVGLAVIAIIAIIAIIWLATGVYQVGPGEQAALRLFGAAQGEPVDEEGLHWWWPGPIGKKKRGAGNRDPAHGAGFSQRRGWGRNGQSLPR